MKSLAIGIKVNGLVNEIECISCLQLEHCKCLEITDFLLSTYSTHVVFVLVNVFNLRSYVLLNVFNLR